MLTSEQSQNPRFVLEKVSTGDNIFRIIPENIQGLGLTSSRKPTLKMLYLHNAIGTLLLFVSVYLKAIDLLNFKLIRFSRHTAFFKI